MALKGTRSEDIDLSQLLKGIESGTVALPNFQRDFEWTDQDVRLLLATILSAWPVGSLLLIDGGQDRAFYDPRPFEEAPALSANLDYIVLDGQQRLTALYHALWDKSDIVYALTLDDSKDYGGVDALDELLVTFPRERWSKFATPADQWAAGFLPISALRDAASFFLWRDQAIEREAAANDWLTQLYSDFLSGIHNYRIPAVVIGNVGPAAVSRIFERVNRTGMMLGTFDLMVAKSFGEGFNLRELWEIAQQENELVGRYLGGNGLPILSAIALRQRGDLRQSAVLDLPGSAIRDGWHAAVDHFEVALRFASTELGLLEPDWVPYRSLLTVLAATAFDVSLNESRDEIRTWYWSTVLGRRYDVASNTTGVSDFKGLVNGTFEEERVVLVRESMLEATRGKQGAFHRTYLNAICAAGQSEAGPLAFVDLLGSATLTARSAYDRADNRMIDPPLHLRTLGYQVWRQWPGENAELLVSNQFGPVNAGADPAVELDARAAEVHRFARTVLSDVRLVDTLN